MALINLAADHLCHTRFAQDWIEDSRMECRLEG